MRRRESAFAVVLLLLASSAAMASPEIRRYAVIVANNQSLDEGVKPLSFADDDGAKFHELFVALGAQTELFVVLDADAQKRFPAAAKAAKLPRRSEVLEAVDAIFKSIETDRAAGKETHFYFVYSGHGNVGPNREGYINLLDARLRRSELYRDVLARSPATWNHLILDACHSYFLVAKKGGKDDTTGSYREAVEDFLRSEDLASYPNTGVILAASSESETHEWSRWAAGIFSHELRSALLGAADVDGDGEVTYAEAGTCVEAANAAIDDPRARLKVFYRAPAARADAALVDLSALSAVPALRFEKGYPGRYHVEDARGVRVADLHPSGEQRVQLALLGQPPFFLRGSNGESKVPQSSAPVVASSLEPQPLSAAHKGAVEQSFRRHLYETPFGAGFYRGAVAAAGPGAGGPVAGAATVTSPEPSVPRAPPPGGGERLAILELTASGVDKSLAYNLSELMTDAAGRTGGYTVLSMADVAKMLAFEGEKQKLGCMEDISCLAEMGGALGVDKLLTGSVGKIGDTFQVTLKLLDIGRAEVLDRRTETVKGQQANLIDAVRLMTSAMLSGGAEARGRLALAVSVPGAAIRVDDTAVGTAPLSAPLELNAGKHRVAVEAPEYEPFMADVVVPSGGSRDLAVVLRPADKGEPVALATWGWVSLGAAVAVGAGGIAAGALAKQSNDEYQDATDRDEALDLRQKGEDRQLAANVLFGVAGAAAATGLILVLVDYLGEDAPAASAGVVPTDGGAVLGVTGRW